MNGREFICVCSSMIFIISQGCYVTNDKASLSRRSIFLTNLAVLTKELQYCKISLLSKKQHIVISEITT